MRSGNKNLGALGAAELLLGAVCMARTFRSGRVRLPWVILTAAAVTAGTFSICGALTERKEETAS